MVPNIFTLGVLATSLMFFWYIFQFAWIKWVCVSFYQMLTWQNFIGQQGYKEQTSGKNCRALKKWKSLHLKQGNGLTYGWWNSKLFTVFCCYKWRLDLTEKVISQPKEGYSIEKIKISYEKLYQSKLSKNSEIVEMHSKKSVKCQVELQLLNSLSFHTSVDKLHSSAKSRILTFGLVWVRR